MARILVVDDDAHVAGGLRMALEYEGYEVVIAVDGVEALTVIVEVDPALVLLDLGLPRLTGLAVMKALRAAGDPIPILVLTARSATGDRVAGLDVGADDYIVKPFDIDELLARVRAVLRRTHPASSALVHVEDLTLHRYEQRLASTDESIQLTRQETRILAVFMTDPDRVHPRAELVRAVWDDEPHSNALDVCISGLRKKIAKVRRSDARQIHAVRGLGYRLSL